MMAYGRQHFLLVIAIAVIITHFVDKRMYKRTHRHTKCAFVNRSPYGYKYETDTMTFMSNIDRKLARDTLIALMKKEGKTYTIEQIAHISDSFLLQILEVDDEFVDYDGLAALKAKFDILVSPNYKTAYTLAYAASQSDRKLKSDVDRKMLYDIIAKYFQQTTQNVNVPILQLWPDALLIQTFLTLQLPNTKSFTTVVAKTD